MWFTDFMKSNKPFSSNIYIHGSILYSGVASTYLRHLDDLQSRIERSCSFAFQPLSHRQNAAIMGWFAVC